MKNNKWQMQ